MANPANEPTITKASLLQLIEEVKSRVCGEGDTFVWSVKDKKVTIKSAGDNPPPPPNGS